MFGKTALALTSFGLLAAAVPGGRGKHHGQGYPPSAPAGSCGASDIRVQDASNLLSDPLTYGPAIELVHLYYDEWPTGITVSQEGRLFSNYPPGLDANNTNNGRNGKYTVAELNPDNTETPYPSVKYNSPPGGAINYTVSPPVGPNYQDYFIGVQSVVIDGQNRLWALDTGRALTPDGVLVTATYGGPKLVQIDLCSNQVVQTILFPLTVAYPDSYLNDIRFDLRPDIASGQGVAYITDSSLEGRNGIVIVDLGSGESWRHLDRLSKTHPLDQWVATIWGVTLYSYPGPGLPLSYTGFGSDGIALSADGLTLYWKVVAGRYLYSIPTAKLLSNTLYSEILAEEAVNQHTETGVTDGMETDTNGFIYHGNLEQNALSFYNPVNGSDTVYVRDPRISWIDTLSVATDGYLYFTNNQLFYSSTFYPGTDRRQRPFSLLRVPLPNGGTKVTA